jgi:(p)ppGpp synthase/HD superfamily hydrolase
LNFLPSSRFVEAVSVAGELHGRQTKKGGAPFLAHLLEVCALVLRAGGDEDQGIAALLHDGPEKSGGRDTLAAIGKLFGPRVAQMVADCTDSFAGEPKPKWRIVKEQQIIRFRRESLPESCLVYAADKLANGREIHRRLRTEGPQVWEEYGGGRDGHLWYFRAMYEVFVEHGGKNALLVELDECLTELESAAPGVSSSLS